MFTLIFSAAFIAFLILAAFWGLIKSGKCTLTESLAKIIIAVLSAAIAIIPSTLASWYIAKPISSKLVPMLGASVEDIIRDVASLGDVITLVVAAVLTLPVFIILFSIIRLIANKITLSILRKKKGEREKKFSLTSALLGAICGVLVCFIISVPVAGTFKVAGDLGKSTVTDATAKEILSAASENAGTKAVMSTGEPVYSLLTTYKINGDNVSFLNELDFFEAFYTGISGMNSEDTYTLENAASSFKAASELVEKTSLFPTVFADFINAASGDWLEGRDFHGIPMPTFGEGTEELMKALIKNLAGSTPETMREDLATISTVLSIVTENSADGMSNILSGKDNITQLSVVLLNNERLSPALPEIVENSDNNIALSIDLPDEDSENYDDFVDSLIDGYHANINGEVTEESINALASSISATFEEHSIEVEEGYENVVAAVLVSEFGDGSDMDHDNVKQFIDRHRTITEE